jgi:hypothetical protein
MPANFFRSLIWPATVQCAWGRLISSPAGHECGVKKPINPKPNNYCATDAGSRRERRR